MPRRQDLDTIIIIGAGPIIIGQACEFDYSGTQACKSLAEENYRLVLINSNPATIMTDPELADATYIEPITPEIVARILQRECELHPDETMALLPTMGGQTALNTALALDADGTLEKLGIELIGASIEAIKTAEDRQLFRDAMSEIGLESPRAMMITRQDDPLVALEHVGLPVILRPSFTMGGTGGGIATNREDYLDLLANGLRESPSGSVLVEESVLGWKEFEMEVVRDKSDNCIIICSIENIDPMGVHTGDSITVAPALTLSDKEFQVMRNASIAVLRRIGVETGGSNVQFAVNPVDGRLVVIEMNPRVSRSSALASKATGFPIAKIAAKLAVGYSLDELKNDITKYTTASFEPAIDYVVIKIPRFAFEKFPNSSPNLTTSMKSVGEAMAIGRSFAETFQKALRSMENGLQGFDPIDVDMEDTTALLSMIATPTPERILAIGQALRAGLSVEKIAQATGMDKWFIGQFADIIAYEQQLATNGAPKDARGWLQCKQMGFSDNQIARITIQEPAQITALRKSHNVVPTFKRIDTCAAEFKAYTSYLYSCFEAPFAGKLACEADVSDAKKIVILGGGPNRIGQGIEFDYCCVHAVFALQEAGYETIMINCNPETVSTDYDTADRLYFEPLCNEEVLAILHREQDAGTLHGVIVQYGGQTPLKLAHDIHAAGIPILGTQPEAIDLAEDREQFQQLLHKLQLRQPANGIAYNHKDAVRIANDIGFPLVIRPSYVLGGRAMEIVADMAGLEQYIDQAVVVSGKDPVLLDVYLHDAIEVDVDAICDGKSVVIAGLMEHIEQAGIHSGDSACCLPPHSLSKSIRKSLCEQTKAMALKLGVVGLMNVQFAVQGDDIFIIEVNPRASRTVPFVAKATGVPIAKIAARIMAGEMITSIQDDIQKLPDWVEGNLDRIAIKEAVFPFNRFPGVDIMLGPEMRSTGEVMGLDRDFDSAFAKAQLAASIILPKSGNVFVSLKDSDKPRMGEAVRKLVAMGFTIIATHGTAEYLRKLDIVCVRVNKVLEGNHLGQPHIVDMILNDDIALVCNTTEGKQAIIDSRPIRQATLRKNVPYYTTMAGINAAVRAINVLRNQPLNVAALQDYC